MSRVQWVSLAWLQRPTTKTKHPCWYNHTNNNDMSCCLFIFLSPLAESAWKKWEFTFLSHDRFSIIGILSGYEKGVAREERSKSAVYCIKIGLVCLIFLNKLLDYYDFLLCIYFLTTSRSIDGVYTKKKHNNEEVEARRRSRDFFSWINFLSPYRLLE